MVAISTYDNPYDPFEQFIKWYNYDVLHGYNSCSLLDRLSYTSDALTDEENAEEIERAIDEIIKYDPLHIYTKVTRTDERVDDNAREPV